MASLSRLLHQFSLLLAILNLLFILAQATPTPQAAQLLSLSNDLSSRTRSPYNAAIALTSHSRRTQITKGTFYSGLWSLALTTTTFLAQGPSSSIVPASDIESFAQQILDRVATRIATGAAEKIAFGWALEGVSITFASWTDPVTYVAPGVPWAVVQEFVTKFVLWRAQRGTVLAFSGNIWGPSGECIKIVLEVAGVAAAASNILDSAGEIHGSG